MKRSVRFMERVTKLERDYATNLRKMAEQEIEVCVCVCVCVCVYVCACV